MEINIDSIRDEYPFEPHYISTGTMRMHYVDEGSGPVLLLLHACPMWSFSFRKLIQKLSSEYRVIAPDLIGFGLSDKPDNYDYRLDSHADNLERLVDQLGIAKMSILMHGWGATIGCAFIIRHPQKIENIIVLNSMAFTGYTLPWRLRLYKMWPWLAERFLVDLDLMFNGLSHLPPRVRRGYLLPYRTRRDRIAILRFISELPCVPDDKSFESVVEIEHGLWLLRDHPLFIVWAGRDWLYPEKYLKRWMEFCPGAKVRRIPRAGRYVTEEAGEELVSAVSAFLKAHRS